MKVKDTYEKWWTETVTNLTEYGKYERDRVLDEFFIKSGKILDVGCGDGSVMLHLKKKGYEVHGIDFSPSAIKKARNRGLKNLHELDIEKEKLPYKKDTFDYVFWGDVIEHLFNPEDVLIEIKRVLKSGGLLVVSCPNVGYWRYSLAYLFSGSLEYLDVVKQKPWEQEHIRFYNINILREFFSLCNFSINKVLGVNSIWHSRLFAKKFPHLFANILVFSAVNKKVS